MAEQLHVIVARSANVTHKPEPIVPDRQRREMVAALGAVDEARLGHTEDFFVPIRDIDPDVIVLGHDQHHDEETLSAMLEEEGLDCAVARASARDCDGDGELLSTGRIIEQVCERRC